ncbi:TPA: hypothetical protein ACUMPZ_001991 [Haemophilus influenzae]
MAKILECALESRGSANSCQLKFSSGIYYILTGADRYWNRFDNVAEEVAGSFLRTTDKEHAYKVWKEYTRNYYSER